LKRSIRAAWSTRPISSSSPQAFLTGGESTRVFKPMYDCGYEAFMLNRNDTPVVPVPAGSRVETTCIINLLCVTPGVADGWAVLSVTAGNDASSS
jgi:hypothetical protein